MISRALKTLLFGALLALPVTAFAQEATLSGTVMDSTSSVLPGVTITAVHQATGNRFVAVSDGRGSFRLPVRIGEYVVTAELQGFTTVTRGGVQLLVGQNAVLNLQMAPSTLQETVTVTAEAPLLDMADSSLGGNIDPKQMSELPVQGRDWMSLALLAPGNRTTAMGGAPVQDRTAGRDLREFQINLDGQQVTGQLGPGGQPRFSRDAIAEFQFISNRFDATQGRSSGVQVNAITKSGSNLMTGMFGGYFRNSKWSAPDPVLNRVVPLKNQQYSATLGGPIIKDRLHYFGAYEYEHEPRTTFSNTAWPSFNVALSGVRSVKLGSVRLDYQLSPKSRLMFKGNLTKQWTPFDDLGANHPAATGTTDQFADALVGQWTRVIGSNATNQVQLGYSGFGFKNANLTTWSHHWRAADGINTGSPRITFTGFSIVGNTNYPRYQLQDVWSARDDYNLSYEAKGRHDLKAGGEFLWDKKVSFNCANCMGIIDARQGAIPTNIEALFPDPWNADTWNLAAISPNVRTYTIGVGQNKLPFDEPKYAAWVQDDWHLTSKLTVNLGARYDLIWDAFANWVGLEPWMKPDRPQDADNIQPRLGFAYTVNDRTVIRGGSGKYYADVIASNWTMSSRSLSVAYLQFTNDGRPDFAANPLNGAPLPTYEQALPRFCYVNNVTGCLDRAAAEQAPQAEYSHLTHDWQSSIGFQRQLAADMAVEADYVYTRGRNEKVLQDNANITFNPATGAPYPFSNRATRAFPTWGVVGQQMFTGWSNYHGLQSVFTKRLSHNWQGSLTYTLSALRDGDPAPLSGITQVTFPVTPDLGGEYGFAVTDQRHRAVFNGIWQVVGGFQVSGIYFYGSGERYATSYGGDLRGIGATGSARLRPDGSIVPRNSFVGDPVHRVDMRLQQSIRFGGRRSGDLIAEVFNLFDRANYGSYTLQESSPRYRLPNSSSNLAYAPRTLQLGFRIIF
jgi:Carboxypeptidase regulatory-like domain/TonB dependent receptor